MPQFDCKFLSLLILLAYCTDKQGVENQFVVTSPLASIRMEPTEKSQEIAQLRQGEHLADLNEVSMSESVLILDGERIQSPWMKVQTPQGEHGWILAWSLMPREQGAEWLQQKRLECYFGHAVCGRLNVLSAEMDALQTDTQLSKAWRESRDLRDTMLNLLAGRALRADALRFDWLNEVLPGHYFQTNTGNGNAQLLADFRLWHQKALQTTGKQDDVFFQTCLQAYPLDGTESFAPVWKFELPDGEQVSHLGAGHHLQMLQQIDRILESGLLFEPFLKDFKERLLEDVFGKNQRYWLSREKIQGELADIVANSPRCLSQRELESVSIRQKMFDAPAANGITVSLRSGTQ